MKRSTPTNIGKETASMMFLITKFSSNIQGSNMKHCQVCGLLLDEFTKCTEAGQGDYCIYCASLKTKSNLKSDVRRMILEFWTKRVKSGHTPKKEAQFAS
ncbi:MAG: hypothetical protein JW779_10840 [Candidatus Thorarchaeota archaeon]|nr:hypothetical protein [Candidatus Thorarchaeota archaeon]